MSINILIQSIEIALLRDASSKIAVHTDEQKAIGERAVFRARRNVEDITFLVLPPHLHAQVEVGTILGDTNKIEAEAKNNAKGIQVVFDGRER